jgi:isochorismate hydrolase
LPGPFLYFLSVNRFLPPGDRQAWKRGIYGTDLHAQLQRRGISRGISHLLFAGVTTEVCVQSSMRAANDRGYECLLVEDAIASYFPHLTGLDCARLFSVHRSLVAPLLAGSKRTQ